MLRPLLALGLAALLLMGSHARAGELTLEIDPEVLRQARERATEFAAPLLRDAILRSRQEAVKAGVQPLPLAMRAKLQGYYPEALLDRVRWRAGGGSEQSLQLNVIQYGDRSAITLDEVVVFAREADALSNAPLWAHELWHVQQFASWGVDSFALRYVQDYRVVEAEAESAAEKYLAWLQRRPPAVRAARP